MFLVTIGKQELLVSRDKLPFFLDSVRSETVSFKWIDVWEPKPAKDKTGVKQLEPLSNS